MNLFKLKSKATKTDRPISPSGKSSGQSVRSVLPFGNKKKSKKPQQADSLGRDLDLSRTPSTVSTDSHSSSGSSWSCHGNRQDDRWDYEPSFIYPDSSVTPSNDPSVYPQSSAASSMYHLPSVSSVDQSRERLDRLELSQSSSFFYRPNGSQSSFHLSNKSQSSFHHPHPFLPASSQAQQTNTTINRSNLHASLPSDVAEYNPFGCRPYPVPASLHHSIDGLSPHPSHAATDDDDDDDDDDNRDNNRSRHGASLDQSQSVHPSFPVYPASSRARAGSSSLPTTANRSRASSIASNRTTGSSIHSHSTGAGADSTFHGSSAFLASGLATRARSTSVSSAIHGTYHPPHPSPLGHSTSRLASSQDDLDEGEETLRPSACCPAQLTRSDDLSGFPFPSSLVREQETEKEDETELADVWKDFMKDVTLPIKPSTAITEFIHKPNRPPPPPPSSSAPSSALPPVPSVPTATSHEGLRVRLPVEDAGSEPFELAYLINDGQDRDDEDDDLTVNLSHLVLPSETSAQPSDRVSFQLPLTLPSRLNASRDRQSALSTRSFASSVSSARSSEPATPSFPPATTAPLFYHPDGSYLRANVDQTEPGATHEAHTATDALQTEFWRASKTMVRAPTWWSGPPPGVDATLAHSDSNSELATTERPVLRLETAGQVQSTVAWGEAL